MATEPVLRFMAITRKITFITGRGRRAIGGQGCEDIKTSCVWFKESWASVWLTQIVHFCIVKVDFGIRLWFMPRKHIYDSERIKNFAAPLLSLRSLLTADSSQIYEPVMAPWFEPRPSPPGHSAVTVEEAIMALHWDLEMTQVTDDIIKSHFPPSSTPESSKLRHRNEVAELAERHPPLPSFSSRLNYLLLSKGLFSGAGTLQIKKNFSQQQLRDVEEKWRWEK